MIKIIVSKNGCYLKVWTQTDIIDGGGYNRLVRVFNKEYIYYGDN